MKGDEMTGPAWLENEEATNQVIRRLAESGAPLEAQLDRLCARFATVYHDPNAMLVYTQPVIYGLEGTDLPAREVDQLVTLYHEFELSETVGIQLVVNVVIEAKYRHNAQVFGVEVGGSAAYPAVLPVTGSLARSSLIRKTVASTLPSFMANETNRRIALLLFKDDGRTPMKVSEENLVYKAASSLYDFIRASAEENLDHDSERRLSGEPFLDEFHSYIGATHYPTAHVARGWIWQVSSDRARAYDLKAFGGKRLYHSVEVFVPVICVDLPMFKVELDGLGNTIAFEPSNSLLTSAQLPPWPVESHAVLARRTLASTALVTTLSGLESCLKDMATFFSAIRESLKDADGELIDRAVLEQDFLSCVEAGLSNRGLYRSDLYFDL